jgi:hypothetical protein
MQWFVVDELKLSDCHLYEECAAKCTMCKNSAPSGKCLKGVSRLAIVDGCAQFESYIVEGSGGEPPTGLFTNSDNHQVGGTHYTSKTIQPWDVMSAWMTRDEFAAYLRGNVIKYIARYKDKNGVEDLKKAQHYLEKLIDVEGQANDQD